MLIDYDKLNTMERDRALTWLDAAYQDSVGKLTPGEGDAISQYAAGRHAYINCLMRNPERAGEYGTADVEAVAWINNLVNVIKRAELPQATRLYRGIMWDEHGNTPFKDGIKEGVEFREDSFLSTSLRLRTAVDFATSTAREWVTGEEPEYAVLHMIAPRGMPSIHMNAMAAYNDVEEEEILLAPSSWRIDKVVEKEGVKHALVRCTALHLPEKELGIVCDPVIRPGGYRRHPLAPTYYHGDTGAPAHGLSEHYHKPKGVDDHYPWVADKVLAQQQDWFFIVDGEEIEWGDNDDYLIQDPETGACWKLESTEFEGTFTRSIPAAGEHSQEPNRDFSL
jgi:hypothetical protein